MGDNDDDDDKMEGVSMGDDDDGDDDKMEDAWNSHSFFVILFLKQGI